RVDNAPAPRIVGAHERTIDLDGVVLEPVQIRKGRIAGAEVVEMELDAGVLQRRQFPDDSRLVMQQRVLGNLQVQGASAESGLLENASRTRGELGFREQAGRDVDTDR